METQDGATSSAQILDPDDPADSAVLERLRADPNVDFLDHRDAQLTGLHRLRPPPNPELLGEPGRWAYFPWRRTAVAVLGQQGFRAVRLDRNRNNITTREQDRLGALRIGVAGLSVGHVIAHTLAAQGLCGQLRLADFDQLELSNLNRVPATVLDLGFNKAQLTARRIAELDPYLPVEVFDRGIAVDSVEAFLDDVDILVEECDSLDAKVLVRQAARARRIPVLMATGDRGTLDVERFDLEPQRQILHNFLGDVDFAELTDLPSQDKVPYALRMMDGAALSPRMAASLVEVGTSLSTWPQVVAEVAQSAALVAEAVRRIGLGEELSSGRARIDLARDLDGIHDTPVSDPAHEPAAERHGDVTPRDAVERVAAAAARAPSGGNAQPWHMSTCDDAITIALAPEYTSTMDVAFRGS